VPRHVVATVDEIPVGKRKLVTVDDREIVIFNLNGEFYGLLNRCPHQGGKLCDGVLAGIVKSENPGDYDYSRSGEIIRCPWHGWHFDIRTGQSWGDPDRVYTKHYTVSIEAGKTLVEGPYKAETVEVCVDNDYIVIET